MLRSSFQNTVLESPIRGDKGGMFVAEAPFSSLLHIAYQRRP